MLKCITVLMLTLACLTDQVSAGESLNEKPNIVILLADDLGWGDVGFNGGRIDTPNIDQLARDGIRLSNFRVEPLCSPTRASLMTGRWPIRYGMGESVITPWRQYGLPTTERTLADLVAEGGYERRAAIGKWHLGHFQRKYLPLNRGFTFFYGLYNGNFDYFTHKREGELDWHRNWETSHDEGYATDLIAREAVQFIEESPTNEPFFLYVPFNAPHSPMQAKPEDIEKYVERVANPKHRTYAAMVDSMDQAIGSILTAIDKKGIRDNTCILFFSDNGGAMGFGSVNRPWRGGKGSVYEGGVRVPAVIHWPAGELQGGSECGVMMGAIDVFPTVKAIAGIDFSEGNQLDGQNVVELIRGSAETTRRPWFSYIAQGAPERIAVLEGSWKLVVTGGPVTTVPLSHSDRVRKQPESIKLELFDLDRDPSEGRNLAESKPEVVTQLLKKLYEYRKLKLDGIPNFREGRQGFVAPKEWKIQE